MDTEDVWTKTNNNLPSQVYEYTYSWSIVSINQLVDTSTTALQQSTVGLPWHSYDRDDSVDVFFYGTQKYR